MRAKTARVSKGGILAGLRDKFLATEDKSARTSGGAMAPVWKLPSINAQIVSHDPFPDWERSETRV